MNRETRTFVWGLLIFFVVGTGLVYQIHYMIESGSEDWLDFVVLFILGVGTSGGVIKIIKTTD